MEFLKNQIKETGWYIKEFDNYILLSSKNFDTESYIDSGDIILCNEEGVFKDNRGKKQFLIDLGTKTKNLFATYMYVKNNQELKKNIEEQLEKIENSNNNDIAYIFSLFFSNEYLMKNLNLDLNKIQNNSLNLEMTDNFYDLYYIKDDYKMLLQGSPTINDLYCEIFKYLSYKKEFDEIIKNSNLDLSSKEILQLFSMYSDKIYAIPEQIEKEEKKTL